MLQFNSYILKNMNTKSIFEFITFKITIEVLEVPKKIQRCLMYFTQCSPKVTFYITVVQDQNREVDIGKVCVCVALRGFITSINVMTL